VKSARNKPALGKSTAARNRIGRYAPGPFIAALRAFIAGEPVADGIPQ